MACITCASSTSERFIISSALAREELPVGLGLGWLATRNAALSSSGYSRHHAALCWSSSRQASPSSARSDDREAAAFGLLQGRNHMIEAAFEDEGRAMGHPVEALLQRDVIRGHGGLGRRRQSPFEQVKTKGLSARRLSINLYHG